MQVIPIAVSGSVRTRKQIYSLDAVIHMQESPPRKRFLLRCSSPIMRLAEHIGALRAWCKQCLPSSVKTRRAPSWHRRDARIYGMQGSTVTRLRPCMTMSTPPPPPSLISGRVLDRMLTSWLQAAVSRRHQQPWHSAIGPQYTALSTVFLP